MPLLLSLQYIFIHCGTNNIGHNDPEAISDGLINPVQVIEKKYKDVKIIISSLLPRDKTKSQKHSLVIATNIYLKEACNVNSFSFVELGSGWIVGSSLNMLLFKNDHLHLTKFGYEKLSLLFVSQLNSVLEKTHGTPQEPHLAYSYKSAISFTLNKEEFPPLLSVYSPMGSFTDTAKSCVLVRKSSDKSIFPISQLNIRNSVTVSPNVIRSLRLNTHKQPSHANIRKPSRSVTKLSHLKARNSAHQKLHHDRGVDTKNVSANHLRYKSNHLWWKYHVKKNLIFSSYLCEFLLLLIFLSNNFDFICNNNKQLYFVKMHPAMSEYFFVSNTINKFVEVTAKDKQLLKLS